MEKENLYLPGWAQKLADAFGNPKTSAWKLYEERLQYSYEVLEHAANKMLDTYKGKSFPNISQLHQVCSECMPRDYTSSASFEVPKFVNPVPYVSHIMAREAMRNKCFWVYIDFIQEHERQPTIEELVRLKNKNTDFWKRITDLQLTITKELLTTILRNHANLYLQHGMQDEQAYEVANNMLSYASAIENNRGKTLKEIFPAN